MPNHQKSPLLAASAANRPGELLRLMRPHEWVKNTFVFTGLLFGHAWQDPLLVYSVITAAIAFSFVSSTIYIINDITDREHDRHHPRKRYRPLASGTVSMGVSLVLAAVLSVMGLSLGLWASRWVFFLLLLYVALNFAYSFGLKHVVILDVFLIAAGFMLRILAGTTGVGIPPSQWLLLCGLMVTLFLGLTKRRAEVIALNEEKAAHRKVLEHYSPVLLDKMISISAATFIISYSLYTMNPNTIQVHGTGQLIYTVPFVIYAIFRYIYLLHHQYWGGEPSRELIQDPHILIAVLGWLFLTLWLVI